MLHVRDIRRAIEGLSDEAIVLGFLAEDSTPAALERFSSDLAGCQVHNGVVFMSLRVTEDEDDEKRDQDYRDAREFNEPAWPAPGTVEEAEFGPLVNVGPVS